LDVRRAAALGVLARGQQPLDLNADPDPDTGPAVGASTAPSSTAGAFDKGREVVLYAHLSADAIRTHDPDAVVNLENAGGQLLTADQVADWCGRGDTTRVVVKPVIDLTTPTASTGYQPSEALAEKVRLRDRTCVFPYCHRPARGCDLDHIDPYVPLDEGGPPGQTTTDNLACLCRLHHRMKTHTDWTYDMLLPGVFVWHSPHGHTWVRDPGGTTDLTPDTVEPPERRTS
jgi:hypothetical protein